MNEIKYIVAWTSGQLTDNVADRSDHFEAYRTLERAQFRYNELRQEEEGSFEDRIFSLLLTKVVEVSTPNNHPNQPIIY